MEVTTREASVEISVGEKDPSAELSWVGSVGGTKDDVEASMVVTPDAIGDGTEVAAKVTTNNVANDEVTGRVTDPEDAITARAAQDKVHRRWKRCEAAADLGQERCSDTMKT
jgi:hypothetical protein